jgi:hypothetical protein
MALGLKRKKIKQNGQIGTFFQVTTWKVPPPQTLNCKKCNTPVSKVSYDADAVTCWRCCAMMADPPVIGQQKRSGNPRGWKFMKEYVAKDGTVYHRGVVQPALKGKRPITEIKADTKPRLSKKDKKELKQRALVDYAKLKELMVDAKTKRRMHEIKREMKPLEKIIKKY